MPFMDEIDEEESVRESDLRLLTKALEKLEERAVEVADDEDAHEYLNNAISAFEDMRADIKDGKRAQLSAKQRDWAAREAGEELTLNLVSSGKVPRGREVLTPDALKPENLPKKPPGRR